MSKIRISLTHVQDGDLGHCFYPAVPRRRDLVKTETDTYQVQEVIWNLDAQLHEAEVVLIVDEPDED